MDVVFVPAPAHGHVNPMLPIAAKLARGGDRVRIVTSDHFAGAVQASGAELVSMGDLSLPVGTGADPADPEAGARLHAFFERASRALLAALAAVRADLPDVFVYDALLPMMGVPEVREVAAPRVALFPTFALPEGMRLSEVLPASQHPGGPGPAPGMDAPAPAEGLVLVTIPRTYQGDGFAFDDRYLFVGPSLREEAPADGFAVPPADGRPLVFVSLGTVASDKPAFYRAALEALAARPWRAVVATGRTDPAALGTLPENVVARPHLPQIAVLRQADLFVTHGGMNSVMESLALGVPMVVVPQMADQFVNARRVAELGLGRAIVGVEPTAETLLAGMDAVLSRPGYRRRAAAMGAEMESAGGAARAAEAIRAYVGSGAPA